MNECFKKSPPRVVSIDYRAEFDALAEIAFFAGSKAKVGRHRRSVQPCSGMLFSAHVYSCLKNVCSMLSLKRRGTKLVTKFIHGGPIIRKLILNH